MSFDRDRLETQARALLASDRLTTPTRRALQARLDWRAGDPRVLDHAKRETLRAVARRMVPAAGLEDALDLGGRFEAQLADGPGDGWRYAEMPSDAEAQRRGLGDLDGQAQREQGAPFAELATEVQDAMLARVQAGDAQDWSVDPRRWFENTLAAVTELAYAHPLLQLAIGYDGMADARGWQDVTPGG